MGICLGFGGFQLVMSGPTQIGGLTKSVKYCILYLALGYESSGDALISLKTPGLRE
jgi:hypothetical protein